MVGGWRGRWSPWAVLGSLIWVCLLCSPHCRGSWDSRGWPPALGTSLPAAPAQQSACHCTAASTPRGTLDLHWVRPQGDLDLRPLSWETSPSLSLSVHICEMGTIHPIVPEACNRPHMWLCLPLPLPPQSQPGRPALYWASCPSHKQQLGETHLFNTLMTFSSNTY